MGQEIAGLRGSRRVVAIVTLIMSGLMTWALPASGQDLVWGTVPSPNRSNKTNTLKAVAAVSANDIWAVGEYNAGLPVTGRRTLAEHWDGTAWTIVLSPNPKWTGVDLATLGALAAIASNDVWAVGYSEDFASFRLNTLTEHWDGSSWKIVPSPNPAGLNQPNQLFGVAAVASNNVWAVGQYGVSELPLIVHWDGARWKPVANSCGGGLRGVAALSATDIWAVGTGTSCHYDGSSWKAVGIAPSGGADILLGVATISASDVWAVGTSTFCPNEGCYSISYSA